MLEGNVHAVVHWVPECAGGGLLKFSESITISGTVLDALCAKHQEVRLPLTSILPSMDDLPYLEDVQVTG